MDENNILNVELYSVTGGDGSIDVPNSGGIEVQSRGNGIFEYTYPDGKTVLCDEFGNVIG